jgi:hypothetical protein
VISEEKSRKAAKEMQMDVSCAVWAEFPIGLGERQTEGIHLSPDGLEIQPTPSAKDAR